MQTHAGTDRGDMRACFDAVVSHTSACADRADMRAGVHAVTAHAGTCANNITNMPACVHTVIADAGAGTDSTDMRAGAHAIAADMRANPNTQNLHVRAHIGKSYGRGKQGERKNANRQGFHGSIL